MSYRITDDKFSEKIIHYRSWELEKGIFNMMIPDVIPYIDKIFTCFSYAIQCREIIDDICNQIVEYRKEHSVICLSVEYHVGSLLVDGYSFAQQNIQQYCHYISEITDCLCQIMNIVFNLGYNSWDKFNAVDILKALNKKKLNEITKLCKNYNDKIKLHKEIDNFNKHNLSITVNEKLSADCIEKVKFNIELDKNKYALEEIIDQSVESNVIDSIVDLLDKILESASDAYNPNRLYVKIVYDENIEDNYSSEKIISGTKIIPLFFKTRQENGVNVIDSINCDITYKKANPIYLAVLNQYQKESFIRLRSSTLETNEFDVMQNGKIIGKYQCIDNKDKDAHYFHFKKFEYKAIE